MPFVKISQLKNPYPRAKKPSRFKPQDILSVLSDARRNPSVSGSVPSDVRLREAAGSDSGKKYKLSGMATPVGMAWHKGDNKAVERQACNPLKCKSNGELTHWHDFKTAK